MSSVDFIQTYSSSALKLVENTFYSSGTMLQIVLVILAAVVSLALAYVLYMLFLNTKSVREKSYSRISSTYIRLYSLTRNTLIFLRYIFSSREWRYRSPWVLMLGHDRHTKQKILDSLKSTSGRSVLQKERKMEVVDKEWHFLNNGIVINLDYDEHDKEGESSSRWSSMIAGIKQLRSERPIDSVVLTISAKVLLGKKDSERDKVANELFSQLIKIQEAYEFVFPVYVLISDCELVDGFQSFWKMQNDDKKSEMFGWSSPYTLDAQYNPDWIRDAFTFLSQHLRKIQLSKLSAESNSEAEDGYFLFPSSFQRLQENTENVISSLFRSSKYHHEFQFRGLYFCGDLDSEYLPDEILVSKKQVSTDLELSSQDLNDDDVEGESDFSSVLEEGYLTSQERQHKSSQLAGKRTIGFIDDLFENKIFLEGNLAKPTKKGFISRDDRVQKFQYGLVAFFAAMFLSLFLTHDSLDKQVSAITAVVNEVKAWDELGFRDCIGNASAQGEAVYNLLGDVAEVDGSPFYINLPMSWSFFNNVPNTIATHLSDGAFEEIIFPVLNCYLNEKASSIATLDNLDPGLNSNQRLAEYVKRVREYDSYLLRLQKISPKVLGNEEPGIFDSLSDGLELLFLSEKEDASEDASTKFKGNKDIDNEDLMLSFIKLNEYLFDRKVPPILYRQEGQHQNALRQVEYSPKWKNILKPQLNTEAKYSKCNLKANDQNYDNQNRPVSYQLIYTNFCMLVSDLREEIYQKSLLENYTISKELKADAKIEDYYQAYPSESLEAVNDWLSYVNHHWLVTSPESAPCLQATDELAGHLAALRENYNYPKELFSHMFKAFSKEACHERLLKRIVAQTIPPYLSLFEVSERNTNKVKVSEEFSETNRVLTGMMSLKFMEAETADRIECNYLAAGWDGAGLSLAISQYEEYELFVANNALSESGDARDIASQIAWSQLQKVLQRTINDAQKLGDRTKIEKKKSPYSSGGNNQGIIAARTKAFSDTQEDLQNILSMFKQLGMTAPYTSLTQCSRRYAKTLLNDVDKLVLDLQLYRKLPTQFDGASAFTEYVFQIDGKADLRKYIDDEHTRVSRLAQYINPSIIFLLNTENIEAQGWYKDNLTFNYWENTLRHLSKFDSGLEENNQLQRLNNYLLSTLQDIDVNSCDTAQFEFEDNYGNDLFSLKRFEIEQRVYQTCNQKMTAAIEADYKLIASVFNEKIAGNYPFKAGTYGYREASPKIVSAFFIDYGKKIKAITEKTQLLSKYDEHWLPIHNFLLALNEAEGFFKATLPFESSEDSIELELRFNVNRKQSSISNQVSSWKFSSGSKSISQRGKDKTIAWNYGDELSLEIDWAKNSDYVTGPLAAIGGQSLALSPSTIGFDLEGKWALFRLMENYKVYDDQGAYSANALENILLFDLPIKFRSEKGVVPSIKQGQLYMALTAHAKNPKTKEMEAIAIPRKLPSYAPELD